MNRRITRSRFLSGGVATALACSLAASPVASAHKGARHHGGYPDALAHYALAKAKDFTRWLNGKHGYIGEVGFPQDLTYRSVFTDEARWADLGKHWYNYVSNRNFWVTAHGVSELYCDFLNGGYYASIWLCPGRERFPSGPRPKVISKPGYQAALLKHHRGAYHGVNFFGGQGWKYGTHSSYKPGVYGRDYWYPTVSDYPTDPDVNGGKNSYEYLYSQGVRLIRLGFRWERVQPRLGHRLDKTELGRIKQSVKHAANANLKVILDLHNYGGYWKTRSGGADGLGKRRLNSPNCTKEHFRGVWRRLSAEFRYSPAVIAYDLMNEPTGHGGIARGKGKSLGKTWEEITAFVHAGIRHSGDKTTIIIPTYAFWPSALSQYHPHGPWIREGGKVRYTIHQYFDHTTSEPRTGGGKYAISYGDENAYRASQGY